MPLKFFIQDFIVFNDIFVCLATLIIFYPFFF